ncbi:leucine-rich repeat domain-containing protein [Rhizophagus clarus]|uniref:Leucine-rich repeat domain-containing protein n=1 Tax=Rhizophagus clarus TaxID=94130 RepID=A0A8H3L6U6_9GLOM|nr:leucine-rich repeat domain-containing protein [Rhizophagus clarus]
MLRKNPQSYFDKNYTKESEEKIDIRKENIRNKIGWKSNLHGSLEIENFKSKSINLERLKLTQLKIINCSQVTEIKLSGLIKLERLVVSKCSRLTNLEIVNCTQLTEFGLSELIKLKSLFVSGCPKLTKLDISHNELNELTELDVNNLIELNCSNTSIKKLSLNQCPDIVKLNCSNNKKLINLDISNCSKLEYLDCSNSNLTSLDVSNCPNIKEIITPPKFSDKVISKKEIFKNILIIGCTGSGKSTLANVLAGDENFEESGNGVSKTETFQKINFEWKGVKYRVIDTTGFDHTRLSKNKILSRIKEGISSVPEGINQILLVVGKNFTDERRMQKR